MVNITCQLLSALKELQVTDLEEFQHYLIKGVEGFKSVPKGLMENPDKHGTVDRMVESYGLNGAGEISLTILETIKQNLDVLSGIINGVPGKICGTLAKS